MTEYMNTIMPIKGNTCELHQNIRYSSNFYFYFEFKIPTKIQQKKYVKPKKNYSEI